MASIYQSYGEIKAERETLKRWALIKQHIQGSTLLDVGANIGAFSLYAAEEFPHMTVLATEQDKVAVDKHLELVPKGKYDNIICHKCLSTKVLDELLRSCFYVDTILVMSVLHWMENPTINAEQLARLGHTVIYEIPPRKDTGATQQHKVQIDLEQVLHKVAKRTGKKLELIGKTDSHSTKGVDRLVYRLTGFVNRAPVKSYYASAGKNVHELGRVITKPGYVSGFNLWDLLNLGMIYPSPMQLVVELHAMEEFIKKYRDHRLWNLGVNRQGLFVLDKGDPGEELWSQHDIDKSINTILKRDIKDYYNYYLKRMRGK